MTHTKFDWNNQMTQKMKLKLQKRKKNIIISLLTECWILMWFRWENVWQTINHKTKRNKTLFFAYSSAPKSFHWLKWVCMKVKEFNLNRNENVNVAFNKICLHTSKFDMSS